ncbi:hypothetical protein LSCM1_06361 [Leishmania martiniquensis]|uniref:Uncharacterized protein n=1 Tax=Leishmania martiniquensis TaxID=1580590 RepID=A0A836HEK7_9TRYP|nr:hypothetical protein LSCM1_06361 [Leishmania martiniquensis]
MGQKKGSYIKFEVNGTACGSEDGTHDVKTLCGPHAVLLRAATAVPSFSAFPPSLSPAETLSELPERLTNFTICAVDARGHFAVEEGDAYEVGAVVAVDGQVALQAAMGGVPRAPAAASRTAVARPSAKKETRRAPTKYGIFLRRFLQMFRTKGFRAAAEEWRRLSVASKKSDDVDALIATVARSGRYPLRSSPS